MGRLISLRLGSTSNIKMIMVPSPTTLPQGGSVTVPTTPRSRPGPVTELLIFPTTQKEYSAVMEEIKKLYQNRHYKHCSARCIQILENIKDPYRVHPIYSIYISFYAASSLELTARSLHINSSNKLPTFQESLHYYQHAESFMDYASFSADPSLMEYARQRSSSLASNVPSVDSMFSSATFATTTSTSSSIRSSIDSIFSASSSTASSLPSPTSSIYGVSELVSSFSHNRNLSRSAGKDAPPKSQKRVSFSETLHFSDDDEEFEGKLSFRDSLLLESFPAPPTSPTSSQLPTFSSTDSPQTAPAHLVKDTFQSYLLDRSLSRYLTHLSSMHTQINTHITSVKAQICTLTTSKKARRSNLPNLFDASALSCSKDTTAHEARQVQLRARIEKLKSEGWRRERFNPEPYRRLCEEVETEMI